MKANRKKQYVTCCEKTIRITEFTVRHHGSQKDMAQYFLNAKRKELSTQILILRGKKSFKYEREIKTILDEDEGKLREFGTPRPTKTMAKQNSLNRRKTLKEPGDIRKEESLW